MRNVELLLNIGMLKNTQMSFSANLQSFINNCNFRPFPPHEYVFFLGLKNSSMNVVVGMKNIFFLIDIYFLKCTVFCRGYPMVKALVINWAIVFYTVVILLLSLSVFWKCVPDFKLSSECDHHGSILDESGRKIFS